MPITIELPESIAIQIRSTLKFTDCRDEKEFVFKAIQKQLKNI